MFGAKEFSLWSGKMLSICDALCKFQTLEPQGGLSRSSSTTLMVSFTAAQMEAGLRHLNSKLMEAVRHGCVGFHPKGPDIR